MWLLTTKQGLQQYAAAAAAATKATFMKTFTSSILKAPLYV
jgi:hypothetical protein